MLRLSALVVLGLLLSASVAFAQEPHYEPSYEVPNGPAVVFVYLGSYDCGPCHDPALKEAVEKAKLLLAERAKAEGKAFMAIGTSLGWDVEKGLGFLRDTGHFDELIVGRNWLNSAALTYLWGDKAAQPALPGIVVYEQTLGWREDGRGIEAGERIYMLDLAGQQALIAWVEAGAPLEYKAQSGGE